MPLPLDHESVFGVTGQTGAVCLPHPLVWTHPKNFEKLEQAHSLDVALWCLGVPQQEAKEYMANFASNKMRTLNKNGRLRALTVNEEALLEVEQRETGALPGGDYATRGLVQNVQDHISTYVSL